MPILSNFSTVLVFYFYFYLVYYILGVCLSSIAIFARPPAARSQRTAAPRLSGSMSGRRTDREGGHPAGHKRFIGSTMEPLSPVRYNPS